MGQEEDKRIEEVVSLYYFNDDSSSNVLKFPAQANSTLLLVCAARNVPRTHGTPIILHKLKCHQLIWINPGYMSSFNLSVIFTAFY